MMRLVLVRRHTGTWARNYVFPHGVPSTGDGVSFDGHDFTVVGRNWSEASVDVLVRATGEPIITTDELRNQGWNYTEAAE